MLSIIGKVLGLLKSNGGQIIGDVARNRLLNKNTPKGIALLLSGGFIFGYLNEQQVNFIVTLVSGLNITWSDMYLLIINVFVVFILAMGGWLIFAKVKKMTKAEMINDLQSQIDELKAKLQQMDNNKG